MLGNYTISLDDFNTCAYPYLEFLRNPYEPVSDQCERTRELKQQSKKMRKLAFHKFAVVALYFNMSNAVFSFVTSAREGLKLPGFDVCEFSRIVKHR